MSIPEPTSFNGSDERDGMSGSGGEGDSVKRAFWSAFEYAARTGALDTFMAQHRGMAFCATWMAEAERRIRVKEVA